MVASAEISKLSIPTFAPILFAIDFVTVIVVDIVVSDMHEKVLLKWKLFKALPLYVSVSFFMQIESKYSYDLMFNI